MLKVDRVSAGYGAITILSEVSLELSEGETKCVIGTNNSGKSTFFKVISGLLKPFSGAITLNGINLVGLTTAESVYENLLLGSYVSRGKKERRRSLEFIYQLFPLLQKRSKQLAGTLSGGEQQMLAIARGLMAKPRVLLLDEPSLGLSPLIIQNIFNIFNTLNEQGVVILLAEQNAEIALRASSQGYVLSNGKVVLQGESRALLQDGRVEDIYLGKMEQGIT
ncbi:MAG: branched-chain amino acid transport system ATP-binding protein [bacterium]|nr:MAG: branched-chain amino acid transport system ATP-binding protein [bacterium]